MLVCAVDAAAVAAQAAQLAGVDRVLTVENPANAHAAGRRARAADRRAGSPLHAPARSLDHLRQGPDGRASRRLLDAPQVSDIMAIESATRFRRPIYAGNAILTVEVAADAKLVGTVRTASFEAAGGGGSAQRSRRPASHVALPTHTRFVSVSAAKSDRPDLQTAARVISGGRALGSAEGFKILYSLADKLGAAVGASRAAVDAGYAPNEMQVGQTGKIIAPELYVAIGISGAIQHLTGIKDARTIVAINKDGEAPIFEVADIGLVGDLFQIIPEIERLIG